MGDSLLICDNKTKWKYWLNDEFYLFIIYILIIIWQNLVWLWYWVKRHIVYSKNTSWKF